MKTSNLIVIVFVTLLSLTCFFTTEVSADELSEIHLQLPALEVEVGGYFDVTVYANLTAQVSGWEIEILNFSSNVLRLNTVTEGDLLSSVGATGFNPGDIDNINGVLTGCYCFTFTGVSATGNGSLCILNFTAVGEGFSFINFSVELSYNGNTVPSISYNGIVTTVNSANDPPTADFTYQPENPTTADVIQFTDNSTDVDGHVVNWTWVFGDGNISYEQNPTHQYTNNGTYEVTLTVKDDNGAADTIGKLVTVGSIPPIADFTYEPPQPTTLDIVYFNSTSFDPDGGDIISWDWEFGDGSTGSGEQVAHVYSDDGIYLVNLTVTDDEGFSSTKQVVVDVKNIPPVAVFIVEPVNPEPMDTVYFNSTSYDPDGGIVNYTWDFGDGTIGYGEFVTHQYSDAGVYAVNLTVEDDDGAVAYVEQTVVVGNQPPTVTIQYPRAGYIYIFGIEKRFPLSAPFIIGKIGVKARVTSNYSEIEKVEFYIDNHLKHVDYNAPYSCTLRERSFGQEHTIRVVAYDNLGNSAIDEITVRIFSFFK